MFPSSRARLRAALLGDVNESPGTRGEALQAPNRPEELKDPKGLKHGLEDVVVALPLKRVRQRLRELDVHPKAPLLRRRAKVIILEGVQMRWTEVVPEEKRRILRDRGMFCLLGPVEARRMVVKTHQTEIDSRQLAAGINRGGGAKWYGGNVLVAYGVGVGVVWAHMALRGSVTPRR